jgi:hypothetical protein
MVDKPNLPIGVELEGIPPHFWESLSTPLDAPDFPFRILDFSVVLNVPEDLGQGVSKRLAFQPDSGPSAHSHRVQVFHSPKAYFKIDSRRPYEYTIDFFHSPEFLDFSAYHFAARIPLDGGEPVLALGECPIETMQGEVENFLRVYTSILLLKKDAVLLHSSAVIVDGEAFIFFGHSGAGKSTSALLFHEIGYPVLSDDLNILFKRSEKWFVQASPFISEVKKVQAGVFPIKRIFFLFQSSQNAIQEVPPPQQMAYLYSNLVVVNEIPGLHSDMMGLIGSFVSQVKVSALHFINDKEFVPWLLSQF